MTEKQNGRQPRFVPHAFAQVRPNTNTKLDLQSPIVDRDYRIQYIVYVLTFLTTWNAMPSSALYIQVAGKVVSCNSTGVAMQC